MIEFVDTHTHLFVPEFDDDRTAVVQRAVEAGVSKLCLPSINSDSPGALLDMCNEFPGVCYPMIGLHPTDVNAGYRQVLERMREILKSDSRFIAVGEVGLDFYWDETYKSEQIAAFKEQIEWAIESGLPLAIHSRNAFDILYSVMEEYRSCNLRGVFHCFSGSEEEALKLLTFEGFYLGIGGVVTYKKSNLPEILAKVPLERVLLETDSPYLTPVPYRGKRNESAYVPYVAKALSGIYGCDLERVAAITTANACALFTKIAEK